MVSRFLLGAAIGLVVGSGILVLLSLNSPLLDGGADGGQVVQNTAPLEQPVAPGLESATAPSETAQTQPEEDEPVEQLASQGFEHNALESDDTSGSQAPLSAEVLPSVVSPIDQGDVLAAPAVQSVQDNNEETAQPLAADPEPEQTAEAAPAVTPAEPQPSESVNHEAVVAPSQSAAPSRPLQAFTRSFSNIEAKPLYAIILIDDGKTDLDRVALARSGFPISFALDPLDPKAAEFAQIYREAGQEVISLASVLPTSIQATAVAQEFDQIEQVLPQAVAVMDLLEPRFQNDQTVASAVVKVLKDQGRGLVSWGGNGPRAEQLAQREGLEQAVIFRGLDFGDESQSVIRRYLDRAVFKAAQEGRVIVAGQSSPKTIEALMAWSLEGKAAMVALAPISAVMVAPK